jgi:hypothetical protein
MGPASMGMSFKTEAATSVCVCICTFMGLTPCQAVIARFAAVRLSCPQPEVTWTFVRILD